MAGKFDPSEALERVIARDAIMNVLSRYAQAIDRCDGELLRSVYWPDGTDNHGFFSGNAMDFVAFIIPVLEEVERTIHYISNVDVELTGADAARVQSYYLACHETDGKAVVMGGRYLDHFERRGGEWRILHRTITLDWNQARPTTSNWETGQMFSALTVGCRGQDDPVSEWRRT